MSTVVRLFTGVVTFAALLASLYLTGLHIQGPGQESVLCDALSETGCAMALQSRFGAVFGVPVALMGVGIYVALLVALWLDRNRSGGGVATVASLACGALVAGGLFLLGVMAQGRSYCPICLFMDGCNVLLLVSWVRSVVGRGGPVVEVRVLVGLGALALGVVGAGGVAKVALGPGVDDATPLLWDPSGLTVTQCQDVELSALEISDFLCPYCKRLERNLASVLSKCGARVDKRFVHFPLDKACNRFVTRDLHPGACRLAEASECARLQGEFSRFSAALFEQSPTGEGALWGLAKEMELDVDRFRTCMETGQTAGRVRTDIELAHRLGVRSTPTFYLNGRRLEGALGADRLNREISAALTKDFQEVTTLKGGAVGDDPWANTEPAEACGEKRFSQESEGGCAVPPKGTADELSFP